MGATSLKRIGAAAVIALSAAAPALAQDVKVGLVAALSGESALSGEAITRGLTIAIDEVNAKGGVLGGHGERYLTYGDSDR